MALGNPKLAKARKNAVASIKALADQHAANVLPVLRDIRRAGRNVAASDRGRFERAGHYYAPWRAVVRVVGAEHVGKGLN